MRNKKLVIVGVTLGLSVLSTIPAFAGQWKQDNIGWWYQEDNGSYPVSTWKWIDGNGDGVAECYYFNASGYMLSNTSTPDSYSVNNDGAWTVNGVVQTKQVGLTDTSQEKTDNSLNDNIGMGSKDKIKTGSELFEHEGIGGSTGAKGTLNGGSSQNNPKDDPEHGIYYGSDDWFSGMDPSGAGGSDGHGPDIHF